MKISWVWLGVGVAVAVVLIAVAARWSKTADYVAKLVPSGTGKAG